MCDDFEDFGSDSDLAETSWRKTIEAVNKDGYRAGLEEGQESSLQEGFDIGYEHSSQLLHHLSTLRGLISGKLAYSLMKPGFLSETQVENLQNLLGDVVEQESLSLVFSHQLLDQLITSTSKKTLSKTDTGFKPVIIHQQSDDMGFLTNSSEQSDMTDSRAINKPDSSSNNTTETNDAVYLSDRNAAGDNCVGDDSAICKNIETDKVSAKIGDTLSDVDANEHTSLKDVSMCTISSTAVPSDIQTLRKVTDLKGQFDAIMQNR